MLRTPLGRLRLMGLLEGLSWVCLLIAMGFKYLGDRPGAVRVPGAVHGALFVGYVAAVLHVWADRRWPARRAAVALAASIPPFGTFALDPSLRREQEAAGELGGKEGERGA